MSGNISRIYNNEPHCPICYVEWDEAMRGVALRCGHIFCEACLQDYWINRTAAPQSSLANRFATIIHCPMCQIRGPLPQAAFAPLALPPGWMQERINREINLIIADDIVPIAEQNTEEAGTLLEGYLEPEALNQIDTNLLIRALIRAAINGCTGNARRLLENPEVMRQILQLEHRIRYLGDVFVAAARHGHQNILALFCTPQVLQHMHPEATRVAHEQMVNEYHAEALIQAMTNQHEAVVTYLLTPDVQRHANQFVGMALVQTLRNQDLNVEAPYARFFEARIIAFIPAAGEHSLGHALAAAALNGHLDVVRALIQCNRFGDIPAEREHSLGHALAAAAQNGHLDVVRALVLCNRFEDISVEGEGSLGEAFTFAVQNEHLEVVRALIQCNRFDDIPAEGENGLGHALTIAANNGHLDMVRALIQCNCFGDIPAEGENSLGHALTLAADNGHLDVMTALIRCDRFDDIPAEGENSLGHALIRAANNGHLEMVRVLIQCNRFGDIPAEGDNSLEEALALATQSGHLDVVRALIQCSAPR